MVAATRRPALIARNGAGVVALALAFWLLAGDWGIFKDALTTFPWDAVIDHAGARVLVEGGNPYDARSLRRFGLDEDKGLGHPPTTLLWFVPLARADLDEMKLVWSILTVGWLLVMLMLAVKELQFPAPRLTALLMFALVLHTSWMEDHVRVVQLSTLIALLYTSAWVFVRRGRDAAAGVALGLACTLKLYPGVVVLFLLMEKRVRLAAAALATWLLAAAVVTARIGTLQCWRQFLHQTEWYTRYWLASIRNGAIQGIVQRIHLPVCESGAGVHAVWQRGSFIASAISLALILLALWLSRRARRRQAATAMDTSFALYVVISMVTGPYAWEHYSVLLVVPWLVALRGLTDARTGLSRDGRIFGIAGLAAAAAMLSMDMHYKIALWEEWTLQRFPARPSLHLSLHVHEVLGWLPPFVLVAVLVALLIHEQPIRARHSLSRLSIITIDPLRAAAIRLE